MPLAAGLAILGRAKGRTEDRGGDMAEGKNIELVRRLYEEGLNHRDAAAAAFYAGDAKNHGRTVVAGGDAAGVRVAVQRIPRFPLPDRGGDRRGRPRRVQSHGMVIQLGLVKRPD